MQIYEDLKYDDLDSFVYFNATQYLSKNDINFGYDEEARELYLLLNNNKILELSAPQIYYFAKQNLSELDDKTTKGFLLFVSDYIREKCDFSVVLKNKYNDTPLVELNDYLPQYSDVFTTLTGDSNVISNFKANEIYAEVIEILLDKKSMPSNLSQKGNPYNEVKSIIELNGNKVEDFIYKLIDKKIKAEETAELEEIAKTVFVFENINGKEFLQIRKNTALASFFKDDLTHDTYTDSFYVDKRNGKLDENINKFFPSVLIPKLENFKSGDIKQTLLDERFTICFCEPNNKFIPNKTASECYFLKHIKNYISQKYIDARIGIKDFKELTSMNDIPKIYTSTINKINELSNGFTLEANESAREQVATLRTLLALRMELTSYKTMQNLKEFDDFLRLQDNRYKIENDKSIKIDLNDIAIKQLFGISNIEMNLVKDRFLDLKKVETDSDLPDFSKSYEVFLDEFSKIDSKNQPFQG